MHTIWQQQEKEILPVCSWWSTFRFHATVWISSVIILNHTQKIFHPRAIRFLKTHHKCYGLSHGATFLVTISVPLQWGSGDPRDWGEAGRFVIRNRRVWQTECYRKISKECLSLGVNFLPKACFPVPDQLSCPFRKNDRRWRTLPQWYSALPSVLLPGRG